MSLRAAGLAATVLVAGVACRSRPAAGARCGASGVLTCATPPDRAFVCEPTAPGAPEGVWSEVPCKGARGCASRGEGVECDDTIAAEGDACPRGAPVDYACTADRGRALECRKGHFALWRSCRGPQGCVVEAGRNVRCDTTLGQAGDPCAQPGTYSCAVDRQLMLACDGRALAPASACRGPTGCHVDAATRKVECDDAVAVEGDPCDQAGRIACAVDGQSELACKDGHYARKRECRRTACRLEGQDLFCD